MNTTAILRSSKIETLTMLLLKLVSPAGPFSSLHSQLTIHPTSSIAHCLLLCCWSANSLFSVLLATHSHTQCLPQKRSRLPSRESPRRLNRNPLRQRFPLLPWREPKDKTGCTKDRVLVSQKTIVSAQRRGADLQAASHVVCAGRNAMRNIPPAVPATTSASNANTSARFGGGILSTGDAKRRRSRTRSSRQR